MYSKHFDNMVKIQPRFKFTQNYNFRGILDSIPKSDKELERQGKPSVEHTVVLVL
ncbi:protein of unknown function [Shewanella benthica]|uniref:Uncharacterized protein n=1 Tax=Shewanella benthica TaxID=43661 RepID=A0A330LX29_9GAMM|nr:protein of unknown function [Shewanella benthica]